MNASELLQGILNALTLSVTEAKGKLILAEDPLHVLELLSAGPGGWGCVLLDKGEGLETKGPVALIRARFALYVWQARGLSVSPGDKIPGLVARCEGLRDAVHALRFDPLLSTGVPQYEGREVVVMPDGFPLNAYELNFFLRISGTRTA